MNINSLKHLINDFSPNVQAPSVIKIEREEQLPMWSVMIPTFNCARFLRQALQSVLIQDPGPELMQIEVIDDCSTSDDPESIVREIGGGRVIFYRNEQNLGATANFNKCIERSRGKLVHILHGDDWVLPGFYHHVKEMAVKYPDASLFSTRSFFVDEESIITAVSSRIKVLENGGDSYEDFVTSTPLQFAGIVIRRKFYENNGGFQTFLVHCADWEMWVRAITKGKGVVSPQVLSCYRVFKDNDTARMVRSAENVKDRLRLYMILSHQLRGFPINKALNHLIKFATKQAKNLQSLDDTASAENSFIIANQLAAALSRKKFSLLNILNSLKNKLWR
jgi:glycosyltransferase involved in cell wall biosynthesis